MLHIWRGCILLVCWPAMLSCIATLPCILLGFPTRTISISEYLHDMTEAVNYEAAYEALQQVKDGDQVLSKLIKKQGITTMDTMIVMQTMLNMNLHACTVGLVNNWLVRNSTASLSDDPGKDAKAACAIYLGDQVSRDSSTVSSQGALYAAGIEMRKQLEGSRAVLHRLLHAGRLTIEQAAHAIQTLFDTNIQACATGLVRDWLAHHTTQVGAHPSIDASEQCIAHLGGSTLQTRMGAQT